MKIIGEYGGGFIVSVTSDEIAKLAGKNSFYSFSSTEKEKIKCGSEIPVSDLWSLMDQIKRLRKAKSEFKCSLQSMGDILSTITSPLFCEEVEES